MEEALVIATRALRPLLYSATRTKVFWPLLRARATIFMLHRFSAPGIGVKGHEPQTLRSALATLRSQRFKILPLQVLMSDLAAGITHSRPVVAFTIDDGYLDHATVAAPVFAEFDCPVTTFVTTGFLDGQLWFWWDQIEYVLENSSRDSVEVELPGGSLRYGLRTQSERAVALQHFTSTCKKLADTEKRDAITRLAWSAEVDIPARAPQRYAPMTWTDLRRCENMTMTFGPHTVTHPILARTSDSQSRFEIAESWNRLRTEARHPVPVWCYPNGQDGDFGEREMKTLSDLGFLGAVTGSVGYAAIEDVQRAPFDRFKVPRFAYPDSLEDLLLLAGGAERMKQIARRER